MAARLALVVQALARLTAATLAAPSALLLVVALLLAGGCAADQAPPPRAATRPRIVLHPGGIENVRFGASAEAVLEMLRTRLGDPDDDTGWTACRALRVRSTRWRRLTVRMSDGAFVGYDLIEAGDPRPIDARTDFGVGLGDTLPKRVEGFEFGLSPSGRVQWISAGAPRCAA